MSTPIAGMFGAGWRLAQSDSGHEREQAVEALAELEGQSAQAALIGALDHEDPVGKAGGGASPSEHARATTPWSGWWPGCSDEDVFVRPRPQPRRSNGVRVFHLTVPERESWPGGRRSSTEADECPIRKGLALRAVGMVCTCFLASSAYQIGFLPHVHCQADWTARLPASFAGAGLALERGSERRSWPIRYLPPEALRPTSQPTQITAVAARHSSEAVTAAGGIVRWEKL